MKIFFTILFFTISFFCKAQSKTLLISEIYGGGGALNATYKYDYIQLFNSSSSAIDLSGYSVQIAQATSESWKVLNLSGILLPNHWYLVKGESDGSAGADLPAEDVRGNFNISTECGKIALVSSIKALNTSCMPFNEDIVDFVGFGSCVNCSETSYAPAHTNTSVTSRINPASDANDNSTDFISFFPSPKNSVNLALPISLNNFNISKAGRNNQIHWQVNCLSTSVTFEVQRSSSLQDFKTIYKTTETKARCATPFDYNDKPLNGSNYYRLKIIDIDGDIFYSKIILSVNYFESKGSLKITPNIITNHAEIHYVSGVKENIQLIVADMQGRIVKKISSPVITGDNLITIQTVSLAPGQYQIKVTTKNNNFSLAKFIKE